MGKKKQKSSALFLFITLTVAAFVLLISDAGAEIPPPVMQNLDFPDSLFSDLTEEDCRFCHKDLDINASRSPTFYYQGSNFCVLIPRADAYQNYNSGGFSI